MSAYTQNKNKGGDYMKIYIVTSFDNEENTLQLFPFSTLEKAEKKQKELAEEFFETLKLKHDNANVEWHFGGAYVWNGEFYEYEIEIFEEEVE